MLVLQLKLKYKKKKNLFNALIALLIVCSLSSCATVFGGKITEAQRTPPAAGEPTRPIRAVALIADIVLFWPGLIVDFVTGAIYKPQGNGVSKTEKIEKTDKLVATPAN